jgi:anti-sigma B factor antagonist
MDGEWWTSIDSESQGLRLSANDQIASQPDSTVSPGQLQVEVDRAPGCVVVSVGGEVDLATASKVAEALDEASREDSQPIVVDLARCAFIDSSGLALLVKAAQSDGGGSSVMLAAARGQVRRALEISGLDGLLPLYPSTDEARAAAAGDIAEAGPAAA